MNYLEINDIADFNLVTKNFIKYIVKSKLGHTLRPIVFANVKPHGNPEEYIKYSYVATDYSNDLLFSFEIIYNDLLPVALLYKKIAQRQAVAVEVIPFVDSFSIENIKVIEND